MKRILFSLLLLFGLTSIVLAAPVYSGAEGYITMPRADVAYTGRMGFSLKYTHSGMLTPAVNIVPFPNLEIGAAVDLEVGSTSMLNPFLVNAKYQIFKNPDAAVGFMAEIPTSAGETFYPTVYAALQQRTIKIADFSTTLGIGYTFGRGSDINFYIGFQRQIFNPKIYLLGDFSNFPYRFQSAPPANASRGIVNLGFRFILNKAISFDLYGLDLMDSNRSIGVAGNIYFQLWNGGHK